MLYAVLYKKQPFAINGCFLVFRLPLHTGTFLRRGKVVKPFAGKVDFIAVGV